MNSLCRNIADSFRPLFDFDSFYYAGGCIGFTNCVLKKNVVLDDNKKYYVGDRVDQIAIEMLMHFEEDSGEQLGEGWINCFDGMPEQYTPTK